MKQRQRVIDASGALLIDYSHSSTEHGGELAPGLLQYTLSGS